MEWTETHDLCLVQEVLIEEPFRSKKGSLQSGQCWESIANNLNRLEVPKFRVKQRSVRERFKLLKDKYTRKMSEEEKASGIETDMSDVENAIEEITDKEKSVADREGMSDQKKKLRLRRCEKGPWKA